MRQHLYNQLQQDCLDVVQELVNSKEPQLDQTLEQLLATVAVFKAEQLVNLDEEHINHLANLVWEEHV